MAGRKMPITCRLAGKLLSHTDVCWYVLAEREERAPHWPHLSQPANYSLIFYCSVVFVKFGRAVSQPRVI